MSEILKMSEEEQQSAAQELLARLALDIDKEEQKFLEMRERLEKTVEIRRAEDQDYLEDKIKEAYSNMRMATEPMRRHRDAVIKELAFIASMRPITMTIPLEAKR